MDQERIAQLFSQAQSAHHAYEQTPAGAVDHEWQAWYAGYVIEQGLNELLPEPVTADLLSRFLTESNGRYEETDKRQPWADFTADDLVNNLGRLE